MKTRRPTKAQIQNAIAAVHSQGLIAHALHFTSDGGFRVELTPAEIAVATATHSARRSGPKTYGEPK